jgi:hypothetical protein
MNPIQRALIEKFGVDNGFEHIQVVDAHGVSLASARHPTLSIISVLDAGVGARFTSGSAALLRLAASLLRALHAPAVEATSGSFALYVAITRKVR